MGRLDGKVAIVTAAARASGEQTARLFAEEGVDAGWTAGKRSKFQPGY